MTQLNRLGGEVNITVHEPSASAPLQADEEKNDNFVDVKLHSAWAVVHIRYGTTVVQEKKRLLKHAKKVRRGVVALAVVVLVGVGVVGIVVIVVVVVAVVLVGVGVLVNVVVVAVVVVEVVGVVVVVVG